MSKKYWEILESINWPVVCQSDRRINTAALQRKLIAEYSKPSIIGACRFARQLHDDLVAAYDAYCKASHARPGSYGGDDSFGDMMWHVIGAGENWYNNVLENFTLLNDLHYREGFQYVMMDDRKDFEEFEWYYHQNRVEQAYGKIMFMRINDGKRSKTDLAIMGDLKARLEMILIGMDEGKFGVVLEQVRDMDTMNKKGSYDRFYNGWSHNESAFFSNVLSDILHNMFDESDYKEPVDETPKVNKRQLLIEQLNCALNQALDGSCKTVQFEWDDTEFSVDLDSK